MARSSPVFVFQEKWSLSVVCSRSNDAFYDDLTVPPGTSVVCPAAVVEDRVGRANGPSGKLTFRKHLVGGRYQIFLLFLFSQQSR